MTSHAITPTAEDYLRTIFVLGEDMQPVIAARVAEEVGVSPSTIVTTLRRLQSQGYLKVERRKEIHLTAKGRRVAEGILRRHFLTERLLTDVLGMDWVKAHQEAHRLEHAISAEVEERLAKLLNNPVTCPHGNTIPGQEGRSTRKSSSLHLMAEGREVVLQRITEGGERDSRLLGFMQDHQLVPGAKVTILEVAPSLGVMNLRVGRDEFALGIEAAKKLRVFDS
ncbi:MAG TPA: metal-dependent transcriptional regulator [Candidatus Binatia bacterium]